MEAHTDKQTPTPRSLIAGAGQPLGRSVSTQVAELGHRLDVRNAWVWVIALLPSFTAIVLLAVVVELAGPLNLSTLLAIIGISCLVAIVAAAGDRRCLEAQQIDRPSVPIWWATFPSVYLALRGKRFSEFESSYSPLALNVIATPFVGVLSLFFADFVVVTHAG